MFRPFSFDASQRFVSTALKLPWLMLAMAALATTTQAAEQRVDLPGGGYVTVDPDYDLPGETPVENAGIVRWYDQNSSLIRAVHGSTANDRVGSGGVTVIGNENFLFSSPSWDNGAVVDAGAWTFSGRVLRDIGPLDLPITASNSMVGSATGDLVISGNVILIGPDSFAVCCPQWDNGAAADAGAVLMGGLSGWYSGFGGVVSANNALVGTNAGDQVGSGGVHELLPGVATVVHSPLWDNGGVVNAGAVTCVFLRGLPHFSSGQVSATNSLVGSSANDQIGSGGIIANPGNGSPLIHSPLWDNGAATDAGAVTPYVPPDYFNASLGVVSSANSLVGSSAGDQIGSGGFVYAPDEGGGVVVHSPLWDNGGAADAGAVTLFSSSYVSGSFAGVVSAANSLLGSSAGDQIGSGGITWVDEVGVVVHSPLWDNAGTANAGAVTLMGNPSTGPTVSGVVSSTNSLVGSSAEDQIGSGGITALAMGVYIQSPLWDNGSAANAGAVTILTSPWYGVVSTGELSAANSLVGSSTGDQVGSGGVTPIDHLGLLVSSPLWDNGAATDAGAVTILVPPWVGPDPSHGVVSASNSLVGSSAGDQIGSGGLTVVGEEEKTFVMVCSPLWDNTGAADAGAVTFLIPPWIGIPPNAGVVSATNSLVGTSPDDQVGSGGTTLVGDIGIVISSPLWDNGSAANAGAVTLMPPPWTGLQSLGAVSATNSLVGSSAEDQVGSGGIMIAAVGESPSLSFIVVRSPLWDNGSAVNAGAVTMPTPPWSGPPTIGVVSAANSVVGSSTDDQVGSGGIVFLEDNNVLVFSPLWDSGGAVNAGAVTMLPSPWFGPPTSGAVSAANSWVGSSANDQVGSGGVEALGAALVVKSPEWGGGAGALTFWWPPVSPSSGVVSGANSLVGSTANDRIGSGGILPVGDHGFLVQSPLWDNGSASDAGALTFVAGPWAGGITGAVVSAANSLVGSSTNDQVGGTAVIVFPDSGIFVVHTPFWDNGSAADAGAVTVGQPWLGGQFKGAISAANSLVGTAANDRVGSGGVTIENGPSLLVLSPLWNNGAAADAGAVTLSPLYTGPPTMGAISAANSLVGSSAHDQVGGGSITRFNPTLALVLTSPLWDNGGAADAGAVTLVQEGNTTGAISASNSIVGSTANDQVGRDGVVPYAVDSFVVLSPAWDNGVLEDAGAATVGRAGHPFAGAISAANSYVGSSANDQVGSGGAKIFGTNFCLIHSPLWDHRTATDAGAITWLTEPGPHIGRELNEFNSLMGSHPNDRIGSGGITVQADPLVTIHSPNWCYGAGAVTNVTNNGGWLTSGVVHEWNSIVGDENAEPEFALQRPVGSDVAENSTHAFGNVTVGNSGSLTFTIRNKGLDDLRLVGIPLSGWNVAIKGPDAAMFSLPAMPPSLLVTGDSASLPVSFSPTSPGAKTATLSIFILTDALALPIEFSVSLTGTGEGVTVTNWRQTHFGSSANTGDGADDADFDRDGIPNLVEYALGSNPTLSAAGQLPQPVRSGGNFTLSVTEPNSVADIIYGAEWSTSLAGGSWQPVTDSGTPPQHVFSVPVGANNKMFMRLKVTPAPPP